MYGHWWVLFVFIMTRGQRTIVIIIPQRKLTGGHDTLEPNLVNRVDLLRMCRRTSPQPPCAATASECFLRVAFPPFPMQHLHVIAQNRLQIVQKYFPFPLEKIVQRWHESEKIFTSCKNFSLMKGRGNWSSCMSVDSKERSTIKSIKGKWLTFLMYTVLFVFWMTCDLQTQEATVLHTRRASVDWRVQSTQSDCSATARCSYSTARHFTIILTQTAVGCVFYIWRVVSISISGIYSWALRRLNSWSGGNAAEQ